MIAIQETSGANEVEAIPAPVQALNAFPPQVAVDRGGIGNACDSNTRQLCCSRVRRSLKLERIQVRHLGQPCKRTERRLIDILQADINPGSGGRASVNEGNEYVECILGRRVARSQRAIMPLVARASGWQGYCPELPVQFVSIPKIHG